MRKELIGKLIEGNIIKINMKDFRDLPQKQKNRKIKIKLWKKKLLQLAIMPAMI